MEHRTPGLWTTRLRGFLEQRFPGRGEALTSALLTGTAGITSAEQGYRIVALARTAQNEERARAFFSAEPFRGETWQSALKGTETLKGLAQFRREFGHRGIYEMEVGGYLSHGAIVAREYGIPAVVNVAGAMDLLHNGESLHVDGDLGRIRVLTSHPGLD